MLTNHTLQYTILKLIYLMISLVAVRLVVNPFQNSQKPNDVLYKAHHSVFEIVKPVCTAPYTTRKQIVPSRFASNPVPVWIIFRLLIIFRFGSDSGFDQISVWIPVRCGSLPVFNLISFCTVYTISSNLILKQACPFAFQKFETRHRWLIRQQTVFNQTVDIHDPL